MYLYCDPSSVIVYNEETVSVYTFHRWYESKFRDFAVPCQPFTRLLSARSMMVAKWHASLPLVTGKQTFPCPRKKFLLRRKSE